MSFQIIGYAKDFRTDTNVLYAQISIKEYLDLIGDNFQDFEIQRKREKHKAYARMKEDVQKGGILPTITLAIKPEFFEKKIINYIEEKDTESLSKWLFEENKVFILDGLQRSFILKDLQSEGVEFNPKQKLLLEFWVEKEFHNLIYRFIVLNAGQKPMSIRHQLDILFYGLRKKLELDIDGLKLLSEKDNKSRSKAKEFQMKDIATSYYCFLIKNYEPAKDNIIAKQMQEDKILLSDNNKINEDFQLFQTYLHHYLDIDEIVFNKYDTPKHKNFLSAENTMNAFFAAAAVYGDENEEKKNRIIHSLEKLKNSNKEDILGLEFYDKIKGGISAAKKNLGLEYKRILFAGFREFFYNEGEKSLEECWEFVAR